MSKNIQTAYYLAYSSSGLDQCDPPKQSGHLSWRYSLGRSSLGAAADGSRIT